LFTKSGDTSVGHALAYCQALEAVSGVDVPDAARRWRTVLLELERVYNHITDVGATVSTTRARISIGRVDTYVVA